MANDNKKQLNKLMISIIILFTLLIVSVGALIARVVYLNYFKDSTSTMVVPDNLIGNADNAFETVAATDTSTFVTEENESTGESDESFETDSMHDESEEPERAASVELYKGQASDNEKFQVMNMLPGDTEVKYAAIKVSHHTDAFVYFHAEVTEQTQNLANALHIVVTNCANNKVIYNGTFTDMNIDSYGETFVTTEKTETIAYYKIEVSLPTWAGNEYQAAKLMADYNWYVKDTGVLDLPQMGDNSNIWMYFVIMCCSLAMIIILQFLRHREKEDKYAKAK